jgi:type III secretion protein L
MSSGKIIKRVAAHTALGGSSITKRQVVDARAEARRIIAAAQEDAAAIRQSAEAFARESHEKAYREGCEASLLEWNTLLLQAREDRARALVDVERDLLRLAVKIAEKILGREIKHDRLAVVDIVATALRQARRHEMVTIRVNPADLLVIEEQRQRLDRVGREKFMDIVPDPRVASGGCVIESESGAIDAQLETQFHVLERALLTRATDNAR